ncbi:MAG: squalene synthase HpnD [Betaproteobacteria bacterium]|nr:squalene synthase HpnD [Betaproteobacteria bacterium]
MTPEEYCRSKAAASGSSFYYSFVYLRDPRRSAMMALYAYCREIDDVVDEVSDPQVAERTLAWWEQEIEALFNGQASHPVTRALAAHLAPMGLPKGRFLAILDGMRMDLAVRRYPDEAALMVYFDRVAGAVGQLAARIFAAADRTGMEGASHPGRGANFPTAEGAGLTVEEARAAEFDWRDRYALHLGRALQWVNVIRDVGEDARRGRIYLPQSWLQDAGLREQELVGLRDTAALGRVLERAAHQARSEFGLAFRELPNRERRSQRPGLIMAAIYADVLKCIEEERFAVLHQRITITPIRKLWLAWRTWLSATPPKIPH